MFNKDIRLYSTNEYSKLKLVLVGDAKNLREWDFDITFKAFFRNYIFTSFGANSKVIKQQYVSELLEDLEELVKTLQSLGVQVVRPEKLKEYPAIKTPYWTSLCFPALNVRDQAIVIGDTIVETAPQVRGRYLENLQFYNILLELLKHDKNMKWLHMPLPTLKDEYVQPTCVTFKEYEPIHPEICIDGAQFIRFNKDIIVNVSNSNHKLGVEWFKRTFSNYRFHVISITDHHIDSFIVPLSKEVVLLRNKDIVDKLPDFIKKYKLIFAPEPKSKQFPAYTEDDVILASKYIDINVLSVDGKHIICNSLFPELADLLVKNGFEPVLVRHRHRRLFGGGFHCFTLDLYREG